MTSKVNEWQHGVVLFDNIFFNQAYNTEFFYIIFLEFYFAYFLHKLPFVKESINNALELHH